MNLTRLPDAVRRAMRADPRSRDPSWLIPDVFLASPWPSRALVRARGLHRRRWLPSRRRSWSSSRRSSPRRTRGTSSAGSSPAPGLARLLVRRVAALGGRPDRRSARHAAAAAAPVRPRLHRAGGGGLRAGPPAGHGRRPAADGPAHRHARARRADRGGGDHRAGQDRRARESATSSSGSSAAASCSTRGGPAPRCCSQVVLESWRLGRDAPVASPAPVPGGHRLPGCAGGRPTPSGRLRAPAGRKSSQRRAARSEGDRPRAGGPRAHPELRGCRGPRRPAVAQLLARAAADANAAGPDQRPPLAGRLSGLRARAPKSCRCSTTRSPMCRCRRRRPLGELGGAEAAPGARAGRGRQGSLRRAARGAGRTRPGRYRRLPSAAARWRSSADWRERAAAAEGPAIAGPGRPPWFLADRDGRGWSRPDSRPGRRRSRAPTRPCWPRPARCSRTPTPRCGAWPPTSSRRAADPADLPALVRLVPPRPAATRFPTRRSAALGAILAIRQLRRRGPGAGGPRSSVARRHGPTTTCSGAGPRTTGPRRPRGGDRAAPIATGRIAAGLPRPGPPLSSLAPDSLARPQVDHRDRASAARSRSSCSAPRRR